MDDLEREGKPRKGEEKDKKENKGNEEVEKKIFGYKQERLRMKEK